MNENKMKEVVEFVPKTDKMSQGIKEVSNEIKGLKQEASNIELAPTNEKVRKASKEALENKTKQNIEQKRAVEISRELNNLMRQASGSDEKRRAEVSAWRREVSKLEREYSKVSMAGGDTSTIGAELSEAYKNLNKALDNSKITGLQKLLNTFKRVGFYRIARRLFQLIEQGLSDSITNLAKFDSGVNDTMSSLTSSFTTLSNSLAVLVYPLLNMAQPILEGLAKTVGNVSNSISYLIAKLSGSSKFLKVNTEYLKDFNKEMNLLSFDKFESLNEKDDVQDMFDEVDVESTSFAEQIGEVSELLNVIGVTLTGYASIKIIKWLLQNNLSSTVKGVKDISKTLTATSSLQFTGVTTMLTIMGTVLAGIGTFKLFDWLLEDATKAESVLITLVGLVLALATAFTFVRSLALGNVAGAMASAIGVGAGLGILVAGAKNWAQKNVQGYYNGGIAEKGDLFIANEKGPELVYSGPNNSSSIMNISQFKQAMVEAIYECADVFQQPDGGVVLNLDGAQIARSKSFKNELNRTNAGLNLR